MRKRIAKSLMAAILVTTITGTTVWADDVTDLTNKANQAQAQLDDLEQQMAYLLVQMNELEVKMFDKSTEIDKTNAELEETQAKLDKQYDDMKLRIKYMYEDQSATIAEALLTAENMSDALNKAEYVQQVYSYDRSMLEEISKTANHIKEVKATLENEQNELQSLGNDMTAKQALLYTTIAEKQTEVDDFNSQLADAVAAAAAQAAAAEAARQQQQAAASTSRSTSTATPAAVNANNNSSVASGVVNLAYQMLGVPYVWGGKSPSGFDCSGLMYYLFGQYGVYVSPGSSSIPYSGADVGSLSNAQPGDIICYAGHVALYIGGGQIIHAPQPGDVVKIASANIMPIIAIRRYW